MVTGCTSRLEVTACHQGRLRSDMCTGELYSVFVEHHEPHVIHYSMESEGRCHSSSIQLPTFGYTKNPEHKLSCFFFDHQSTADCPHRAFTHSLICISHRCMLHSCLSLGCEEDVVPGHRFALPWYQSPDMSGMASSGARFLKDWLTQTALPTLLILGATLQSGRQTPWIHVVQPQLCRCQSFS